MTRAPAPRVTAPRTPLWTARQQPDGTYAILRDGIGHGALMIDASGHADWTFWPGCARPSETTQRRIVARLKRKGAE